eukprot:CAMPEP_0175314888 /NCGR_PEP_ID=MMETSP0093-20121207/68620_1 /TAXON_ID=311494 /ORGANISM="Alexandrium monilatum, Strain CCMP3105" /LENGTH=169 /DNA_ID=CAMNT_0016611617 /DNA_START=32 /DNA_END=541 /DNA_ORIENTATION=+
MPSTMRCVAQSPSPVHLPLQPVVRTKKHERLGEPAKAGARTAAATADSVLAILWCPARAARRHCQEAQPYAERAPQCSVQGQSSSCLYTRLEYACSWRSEPSQAIACCGGALLLLVHPLELEQGRMIICGVTRVSAARGGALRRTNAAGCRCGHQHNTSDPSHHQNAWL